MVRGKFITLEGIDGAGKTMHLAWLHRRLEEKVSSIGCTVIMTREPGGTPLGERLRKILLHEQMDPETEALLIFAARRMHLVEVIEPMLVRGNWVLSDRFTDATFAYQGGGRGLLRDKLKILESWVQADLQPDLTLFFDVLPSTASVRRQAVRSPDRFENESENFFDRTRAEYLRRAEEAPYRIIRIDSTQSINEIYRQCNAIIEAL